MSVASSSYVSPSQRRVECASCGMTAVHRYARKQGWVLVVIARLSGENSTEGVGVRYACCTICASDVALKWAREVKQS